MRIRALDWLVCREKVPFQMKLATLGKGSLSRGLGYPNIRNTWLISKVTKLITQKQNLNPGLATEDQLFNDSALLHQRNVIVLLHSFHFLFGLLPLAVDKRNFHILKYGEVIPAYI